MMIVMMLLMMMAISFAKLDDGDGVVLALAADNDVDDDVGDGLEVVVDLFDA